MGPEGAPRATARPEFPRLMNDDVSRRGCSLETYRNSLIALGKFSGVLCSRRQFHAEFGGLASYVSHVPCGAFAFIICGPPVDVFLTFRQQPIYQTGQVPGHRFDCLLTFHPPSKLPVSSAQIGIAARERFCRHPQCTGHPVLALSRFLLDDFASSD